MEKDILNKTGVIFSIFEAFLRTAYKSFNLYLGTQIYFLGSRGRQFQPHVWVAYFNVEGSTRSSKDITGNISSFLPGITGVFIIKENLFTIMSSLGVMLMTWGLRFENFLIHWIMFILSPVLNLIERIIISDKVYNKIERLNCSVFNRVSNIIYRFDANMPNNENIEYKTYRFISAVFGSIFWITDLCIQHIPDILYPLEAPITDWYMFVGPTVSVYIGLINKNYMLTIMGLIFITAASVIDVSSYGIFYMLGGITKSTAAFLGLLFIGKFHEKMHTVYSLFSRLAMKLYRILIK